MNPKQKNLYFQFYEYVCNKLTHSGKIHACIHTPRQKLWLVFLYFCYSQKDDFIQVSIRLPVLFNLYMINFVRVI